VTDDSGEVIFRLSKSYGSGIFFHQQLIPYSTQNARCGWFRVCTQILQGGHVGVAEILAQIDREIAQLQKARALLNGGNNKHSLHGNGNGARKRNLTPEGRQRISEAVRRRWAKQRKATAGK
jgi:hypothetical protein